MTHKSTVLEVKTGEPGWYNHAATGAFFMLYLALLIEPLQPRFVVVLVVTGIAIAWLDRRARMQRARFTLITVSSDHSVSVVEKDGQGVPVHGPIHCWVTRKLIVVKLSTADNSKIHLLVARSRNRPEAYRRFTVMCRYGFDVDDPGRHNVAQLNPKEA